jgi:replicative DNA helicase
MRAGEVAGLLARPGVGKTIAMCNMAYLLGLHNADLGHMFFSLEMPAPQIIERLRRLVYGLSKDDLRDAVKERARPGAVSPDLSESRNHRSSWIERCRDR